MTYSVGWYVKHSLCLLKLDLFSIYLFKKYLFLKAISHDTVRNVLTNLINQITKLIPNYRTICDQN